MRLIWPRGPSQVLWAACRPSKFRSYGILCKPFWQINESIGYLSFSTMPITCHRMKHRRLVRRNSVNCSGLRREISNSPNTDDITSPLRKKTKWMIISRGDYSEIKYAVDPQDGKNPNTSCINLEDGSKANILRNGVMAYTREEVAVLAKKQGYSLSLRYFVTNALQRRAGTNQLWVNVVCLLFGGLSSSHEEMRKTLENIDQDVGELINKALTQVRVSPEFVEDHFKENRH